MSWITEIFLIALLASTIAQWWLSTRQAKHVIAHRDTVPFPFQERIQPDEHRKAADYTVARERIGRVELLIDAAVVLAMTLGGGIHAVDAFWRQWSITQPWLGTLVILSIVFIQGLIGLPLSIYKTFRIEARFSFNRITPKLFALDLIKQIFLGLAFGGPLIACVVFLMAQAGDLWWLYAWAVLTLFSITLQWAYPAFIAPWFNKFTPLADETLRARIAALLDRCGFQAQGVYVMDGSSRSSHGNAYFTGFGKTKRVVFFDTLIDKLSASEIEGVLAHELGHYRRHHIRSRIILSLIMTFLGFAMLGWFSTQTSFYSALGVATPSPHSALLLFMLVLSPFTFWLTPIGAWWSRRHEFEADEFAAEHANSQDLSIALTKLYRDNASTLTPDPIHSAFYDSHPPALIRIAHLARLSSSQAPPAMSHA